VKKLIRVDPQDFNRKIEWALECTRLVLQHFESYSWYGWEVDHGTVTLLDLSRVDVPVQHSPIYLAHQIRSTPRFIKGGWDARTVLGELMAPIP